MSGEPSKTVNCEIVALLPAIAVGGRIHDAEQAIRTNLAGLKKADDVVDGFRSLLRGAKSDARRIELCEQTIQRHRPGAHAAWVRSRRSAHTVEVARG